MLLLGSLGLILTIIGLIIVLVFLLTEPRNKFDSTFVLGLIAILAGVPMFLLGAGKLRQPLYLLIPLGPVIGIVTLALQGQISKIADDINPIVLGLLIIIIVIVSPFFLAKWIREYYDRKKV